MRGGISNTAMFFKQLPIITFGTTLVDELLYGHKVLQLPPYFLMERIWAYAKQCYIDMKRVNIVIKHAFQIFNKCVEMYLT